MRLIFSSADLRLSFAVLAIAVMLPGNRSCCVADVAGRVTTGGVGRYTAGRWGLVKGTFTNSTDQDETVTAVVTPRGSSGAQFVRSIVVPSRTQRDSLWPVLLTNAQPKVFEFDVLIVRGDQESNQISTLDGGMPTDFFLSANSGKSVTGISPTGYCGLLSTRTESLRDEIIINDLMLRLRRNADLKPMLVFVPPSHISGYAEALEPLDQLVISSPDLRDYPETCDAVRLWIQRGGRALILLDQCGEDSASAILGDALPLSVVDRTSSLRVPLKNDAARLLPGHGDTSHLREFDEPVTIVRTIFEGGDALWSVRTWPVLVEVPFGNGTVFVSAMSPEVFLSEQENQLDAAAEPILDLMFRTLHERPLLSADQFSSVSERRIGYVIPRRGFAAVVLSVFTLILGLVGWFAWKQERPSVLLMAVPLLALVAAVPGIITGTRSRGVAPATLIENRVAHLTPGQATMAVDGVATVYQPAVGTSELLFSEGALLSNSLAKGVPQQRLVWNDSGTSRWVGFSQPVGATSYAERAVVKLPSPLRARAEFQEDGVQISLTNADLLKPEDMLVVGSSADRLAPQSRGEGQFFAGPKNVLAAGQVSTESLLSESQILHAELYSAIFQDEERFRRFPSLPSLTFWTNHLPATVHSTDESLRRESMTLMTLPLEFAVPAVNQLITIPTVLLPCRAIEDADGGVSAAYSNRQAHWIARKRGSITLLQYDVPPPCRPFHFEDAEVQLRILAGSRTVDIQSGTLDHLVDITSLQSPVGNIRIPIVGTVLNADSDGGSVFLRINVGDLPGTADEVVNAEQDDFWKIERVLMTVRGHRMSMQTSSEETTTADD